MPKITMYSTPSCVYCRMAKEYFKKNNLAFEELDVADNDEAREDMVRKSRQLGVPVIDIDGQVIVGFDKRTLDKILKLG